MPANGRWDLIRRLKVKIRIIKPQAVKITAVSWTSHRTCKMNMHIKSGKPKLRRRESVEEDLILACHLRLGLPNSLFPSRFSHQPEPMLNKFILY